MEWNALPNVAALVEGETEANVEPSPCSTIAITNMTHETAYAMLTEVDASYVGPSPTNISDVGGNRTNTTTTVGGVSLM